MAEAQLSIRHRLSGWLTSRLPSAATVGDLTRTWRMAAWVVLAVMFGGFASIAPNPLGWE